MTGLRYACLMVALGFVLPLVSATPALACDVHLAKDDLVYARTASDGNPRVGRILGEVMYRGADRAKPVEGAQLRFHGPMAQPLVAVTGPDGRYQVAAPAGSYRWTTISTDQNGRFTFGVVAGLSYRIVAESPYSSTTNRQSVTVDPSKSATTIRLTLP